MFLALPSSEVFYVIAIIVAWLYIALGMIGNYQAAGDQATVRNSPQIQELQIQIEKRENPDSRTFQWVNYVQIKVEKSTPAPISCYYICEDNLKYRNRNEYFRSSYLNISIPDRAPPVV